jgi:hypothetical protein
MGRQFFYGRNLVWHVIHVPLWNDSHESQGVASTPSPTSPLQQANAWDYFKLYFVVSSGDLLGRPPPTSVHFSPCWLLLLLLWLTYGIGVAL